MFNGVYTALITPMNKNNQIDFETLKMLLIKQEESNVSGVVVLGTTAEECSLEKKECLQIVSLAKKILKTKQLIVGVSGNCTKKVIEKLQCYEKFLVDGYLIGTPYYNKPTQEGLVAHFTKIANSTNKPIILYNIPSRCGISIDFSTLEQLKPIKNIVAIKDACGDVCYASKLINLFQDRFAVLSGNDNLTLPLMSIGAKGVISVAANVIPNQMCEICNVNDFKQAKKIHHQFLPLLDVLFLQTNPICVKYVMSKIYSINHCTRLPLVAVSLSVKTKIDQVLSQYDFN